MSKEKWTLFEVVLKHNNGKISTYVSSMQGHDRERAKELAIKNDWESGIREVMNVKFMDEIKQTL